MSRLLKNLAWVGLLAAGLQSGHAFSLIGPYETWQVLDNGFNIPDRGDVGGPMNVGNAYRRNTPVIYYSFDSTFLKFYGSRGAEEVDKAFALLNELMSTNVSSWSASLSEFPLEAKRTNFRAAANRLVDLRSFTLAILMEQLGLADPIRYAWGVHDRVAGTACPLGNEYYVVARNFALTPQDQLQYSSYINGIRYSYFIQEYCQNPPPGSGLSEAIAIPLEGDLTVRRFSPVAALDTSALSLGTYFTGITRDDAAGLRYLLSSRNVAWEDVPAGSTAFVTNNAPGAMQLLVTSNLTLLAAQSLTNDPATLQALYPNLVITSSSNYYATVWTTNVVAYYTNSPYAPYGNPPVLAFATNRTPAIIQYWTYSFGNVATVEYTANGWVANTITNLQSFVRPDILTVQTISVTPTYSAPYNSPFYTTNVTTRTYATNQVAGEYFLIPAGACSVAIVAPQLTLTNFYTNVIFSAVNAANNTNALGTTNISTYDAFLIDASTNHIFAVNPVVCVSNQPSLRRGIEKVRFVRRNYDSLMGRFYYPETNYFTTVVVTNSANLSQTCERVVTTPDILFAGSDRVPGPAAPRQYTISGRTLLFDSTQVQAGQPGPGTISPGTTVTFNTSGLVYGNQVTTNGFFTIDELSAVLRATLASFDGTTNAPVIYPLGRSLEELERQLVMQVVPSVLPPATSGVPYSAKLNGVGGNPPYIWTLAPNSPALPLGLTLASDGSGVISGTPRQDGTFDFVVQMTDTTGITAGWQVTIVVY